MLSDFALSGRVAVRFTYPCPERAESLSPGHRPGVLFASGETVVIQRLLRVDE